MNIKKFLLVFFILIGVYLLYFVFQIIFLGHSFNYNKWEEYTWIIKNKNNIDSAFSYSYINNKDIYNHIWYNNDISVDIWEFKGFSQINLEEININKNVLLDNIDFWSGEVLDANSDREITINFYYSFENTFNINLDKKLNIIKEINTGNYKGFYGEFHKMSFSNNKNEHQILINNNSSNPIIFLVCKIDNNFFIIFINSKKQFDENIIDILNLPH